MSLVNLKDTKINKFNYNLITILKFTKVKHWKKNINK